MVTARILDLPRRLISLVWKLLVAVNQTHSFPDIAAYKRRAAKVHRLYLKHLGSYKQMSATLHVLCVHGHLYLEWARDVVGVPYGALSESAIECHNKTTKQMKRNHARGDSLLHNCQDIMHGKMWRSDPLLLSYYETIQTVKRGAIRMRN